MSQTYLKSLACSTNKFGGLKKARGPRIFIFITGPKQLQSIHVDVSY